MPWVFECEGEGCGRTLYASSDTRRCVHCEIEAGMCCASEWSLCQGCDGFYCENCEEACWSRMKESPYYCDTCVDEHGVCYLCGILVDEDPLAEKYACTSQCVVCGEIICTNTTCRREPEKVCPWVFCFVCVECTHTKEKCAGAADFESSESEDVAEDSESSEFEEAAVKKLKREEDAQ